MKTTIRTILCAAAIVLAAASCQKSIEPSNPAEEGKGTIDICVNGLMGEYTQQDGVKSSLVNNVRVAWAAGDVVYVFDGSKYLGKLTAALDKKADGLTDEDRYAKLSGTISAPAATPCVLSLVHSSLMTEPETGAAVSELPIDMSAQSTATAPFVAYATMDYTGESISDVVVPFQFATSVIKVNCTGLKPGTAITSATLSNVNTACKLTLSGSTAPTVSGVTNGTITRTGDSYFAAGKVNGEGEAVFQIAVPVLETASEARILTVAQGSDEVKDKNFSKKSIDPATSVNTVCRLVRLPAGALEGEFTVSDPDGIPDNGDEKKVHFSKGNLYYDGNKFDFEDEQYYFRTYNGKGKCDANGYDKNSGTASGHWGLFGWSTVKKFCGISTSETSSEYSGSFIDWGAAIDNKGTWSTLSGGSNGEWKYLFDHHVHVWGTCHDVPGRFIAPDGFEGDATTLSDVIADWEDAEDAGIVFLPAAGSRSGSNVYDVGDYGYYWSSTASGSYSAYYVYFYSSNVRPGSLVSRNRGYSVRLITESN